MKQQVTISNDRSKNDDRFADVKHKTLDMTSEPNSVVMIYKFRKKL